MLCKPTVKIEKNEFNTIFIYIDGALVADSSTFRRKRNFWNKLTKSCVAAKSFTPRTVKANPNMAIAMLAQTGTVVGECEMVVNL